MGEQGADWWRRPFRTLQTNLREVDAGLDVERVLDLAEELGVDTWLLSVGGILSNYPTELDVQTSNPWLATRVSGDLVGDAVEAAGRRGIRVLGRMDFSKVDRRRAERHPEWCFVSAGGEHQVYNDLYSVCPSGAYYQHETFEIITEVLSRYPLSGFFFNWMSFNERDYSRRVWGVCHCLACREGFSAFAPGQELPRAVDEEGYPTWQRFAAAVLDDLTGRLQEHVARLRPGAPLMLGDRADVVFHEANNAVGRRLWHHRTAEAVSAARGVDPETPVWVNAVGFVDMPYRLAGEDPDHYVQYLLQAISRGANPSTYVMGTPDDSPYAALGTAREVMRFHRDHTGVYAGLRSTADVALVRPDPLSVHPGRVVQATEEFQGLYLALTEGHVLFDVLDARRLTGPEAPQALGRHRLVVLPDLGELPAAAVTALDAHVAAGGRVLATGGSAFAGRTFQLALSPVAARLASRETEASLYSQHVVLDGSADRPAATAVPVVGAAHVVTAAETASVSWPMLSRAPYGPPERCHGHEETGASGWLVRRGAAGAVGVVPWTVGTVYRRIGLGAAREAVLRCVEDLAGDDVRVRGSLPVQLEVVCGRSEAGVVVHLLNRSGDADQRFLPPMPIAPVELSLPWSGPVGPVRALCEGTTVPAERRHGRLVLRTPVVDRFEVLVIPDC